MSRFLLTTIITAFFAIGLFNVKSSGAMEFQIGPDGNAYKLIDCSIPENNADPSKCFNTQGPTGAISWESARDRARDMNFEGFSCDLASPSTELINNYLKNFPGFLEACNDCGQIFELCAWFGGRDPSLTEPPGPYQFVNDPSNDIPCPFPGNCDPVVDPGLGTNLTFENWCRVENGCAANEPNGPALQDGQFYLVYLSYLNIGGPVAWADCQNSQCPSQQCQPLSYFVQCDLPLTVTLSPPTGTDPIGSDHTVTATVSVNGTPLPGVIVKFNVTAGPNAGEMSDPGSGECTPNDDCTTDENGQVLWTYTGINNLGTDTIVAMAGDTQSEPVVENWVGFPIPTLSQWGLIAMAGLIGIAGAIFYRRRVIAQ